MLGLILAVNLSLTTSACGSKEAEPVAVARAFADASRRGDVEAMLSLVEQSAVDRVRSAASQASDQVGGRRSIDPNEMLQITGVDRSLAVAGATLLDEDGRSAQVELAMTDGHTLVIELVWEQAVINAEGPGHASGWRVRIPTPGPAGSAVPVAPDA